jgi:tetratricopeptide (TPR) repeat protein
VTGVQTCALPISADRARFAVEFGGLALERARLDGAPAALARAESTFASVAPLCTEGAPLALRAELGLGETAALAGRPAEAAQRFGAVAERAVPDDAELARGEFARLPREERERRFALLELATPGLIAALRADGRASAACRAGLHWWRLWRGDGFALSSPAGENAALELARALANGALPSSGVVAWTVDARDAAWFDDGASAAAHQARSSSPPRAFATRVLLSMLEAREETPLAERARIDACELVLADRVAPDVELQRRLARSAFAAGDWTDACSLYERALPDGAADGARAALEAERTWHLARCAEELGDLRRAEALYREVVELHRANAPWAGRAAENWYRLATRRPPADAADRDALTAATRAARELGSGPVAAEATYREAQRLFGERNFAAALDAFGAVPPEAATFELAWAYRGVAAYEVGDLDTAERTLRDFLEVRCADPLHAPTDDARARAREFARALAELYYGLVAYARAEHGAGPWLVARQRLEPYLARHADQAEFAPLAAARALSACLALGDFAAAELLEGELFGAFPDSRHTTSAALKMYGAREARLAKLGPDQRELSLRMTHAMARELDLANRHTAEPAFANLRAESRAWLELGELARARTVLARIVQLYGERQREDVERWVLPDLARAFAVDGEPERAAALLAPLVDGGRASASTKRLYAHVLGGWCELGPTGGASEHAGVGDGPSHARAQALLAELLAGEPRFEASWYDLRFESLYARWRRGAQDPNERELARAEFAKLSGELGAGFERLAAPDVAAKFRWLAAQIR